jgi:arylsulfatase
MKRSTIIKDESMAVEHKPKRPASHCQAAIAAVALFSCCAVSAGGAEAAKRPNIIIIVTDDMGYSDLGCYGGEIPTPNLDRLAKGGMRFTQFYNNAVCAPTRASLLTGLDCHRAGQAGNNVNPDDPFWKLYDWPAYHGMKVCETVTLPQILRQAGYQTYMAGKWHQGEKDGMRPTHRGFDRYYGTTMGAVNSQFAPGWAECRLDDTVITEFPKGFYTTDTFTDYAMRFIEEGDPNRPFFLYLAHTAPHLPWDARPEDIEKHKGVYNGNWEEIRRKRFERLKELGLLDAKAEIPPHDRSVERWQEVPNHKNWDANVARYAAMVDRIDQNIGRLVGLLESRGELDNTLILYFHDNGQWAINVGGGTPWAEASNSPFRLFKGTAHEGGIRTPLIAHWPARIPAGAIQRKQYAHVRDITPTLLEIAGVEPPKKFLGRPVLPMDGHSFLRAFEDPEAAGNHPIHWEIGGSEAMRDGPWKLVRTAAESRIENPPIPIGKGTGEWELYNLDNDPTESKNLAADHPDRVREMAARHQMWASEVGVVPYEITEARRQEFIKASKPKE